MKISFPKELHAVSKPICLALGGNDKSFPKNSIKEFGNWIVHKAPSGSEIHVYPGAPHSESTVILKHYAIRITKRLISSMVIMIDFAVQAKFGHPSQKYNITKELLWVKLKDFLIQFFMVSFESYCNVTRKTHLLKGSCIKQMSY